MYIHARRSLGLDPNAFWDLTIREYSRECVAAGARARDEYNANVTQAWNTIYVLSLGMSKGIPPLKKLLAREPGELDKPPSMAFQRAAFHMFADQHDLTVRPISKAAKDALRRMREEMSKGSQN